MDCIDLFKRAAMALQTDSRYLAMDQARKMNDKDDWHYKDEVYRQLGY